MNSADLTTSLPPGYSFAPRASVKAEEVIAIRESVGWLGDDAKRWDECLKDSIDVCGVRDPSGQLIGIGFTAGNHRHAVLCDFSVHASHQRQGIGKAILMQRIKRIEELRIPYLYVSLNAANPLRTVYEKLGFKAGGDTMFRSTTY